LQIGRRPFGAGCDVTLEFGAGYVCPTSVL
jgi:hypothetical protein